MASGNVQRWEQSMRYAFRGTALLFLLLGNTPPDQTPGDIIVTAPARVHKELKKADVEFRQNSFRYRRTNAILPP